MSMISAQIDELRRYADMEDGTFPLLASALRDAADTIWQLRDDLQRANAAVQDAEHDESMAWDRVRKAEAENAKLRELVRDLWLTGSLCDAIPDMRLQAKGGDWRTMQERVDEALGIEEDS